MYDEDHHPKNYSQLSAIPARLVHEGQGRRVEGEEIAANAKDKAASRSIRRSSRRPVKTLMTEVAQLRGKATRRARRS